MRKVFLVDDDATSLMFLGLALSDDGFDVRMEGSGKAAIDSGLAFKPDILVSDWNLNGGVDGLEVSKSLQSVLPNLKVILFSGSSTDEMRKKATDIDLFAVLEKPLDLEEIILYIRAGLGETVEMTERQKKRLENTSPLADSLSNESS